VVLGQLGLRLDAQSQCPADPLDVDAEDTGALALAERRDRQPREVAHRAVRAVAQRRRDLLPQRLEVDLRVALPATAAVLGDPAPAGGGSGRHAQAGAASAAGSSITPARPATVARSVRCLRITLIVCSNVSRSMSEEPSSISVRAQSIDSAMLGGFFRSSSRIWWTISTSLRATCSSSSGECRRTIWSSCSSSG